MNRHGAHPLMISAARWMPARMRWYVGAAAHIAIHVSLISPSVGFAGVSGQKRGRRHDLARLAIAALWHVELSPSGARIGGLLLRPSRSSQFSCWLASAALVLAGTDGRTICVNCAGACTALGRSRIWSRSAQFCPVEPRAGSVSGSTSTLTCLPLTLNSKRHICPPPELPSWV